jgi:hypothetical protein
MNHEEKDKPSGSLYLAGVGSLVAFVIGIIELASSIFTDGIVSELSLYFIFFGFLFQLQSKDELGFLNKFGLSYVPIKIGAVVLGTLLLAMLIYRRFL